MAVRRLMLSTLCGPKVQSRLLSTWTNVTEGPPDPILGLSQAFQADTHPSKVNLGVGAYRDDNGKPYVLQCVRSAEAAISAKNMDMEYAGINGVPSFTKAAMKLLFGPDIQAERVVSAQTISGTGSLRIAAEFLSRWYPGAKTVLMPTPTWANHAAILKDSRIGTASYRYYRASDYGFDKEGMLEDLKSAPEGSIILLHACAHNPTGVDPTQEDWKEIAAVMKAKQHFAWFDSAYQGFATGNIDGDAWAVRYFVDQGFNVTVCQSFAKNMGLYGQRVGAVHFVCADAAEAKRLDSQLKIVIRPMYSNPPIHGARIAAEILGDAELSKQWYSKQVADEWGGCLHRFGIFFEVFCVVELNGHKISLDFGPPFLVFCCLLCRYWVSFVANSRLWCAFAPGCILVGCRPHPGGVPATPRHSRSDPRGGVG
eukprot:EG_transcript_13959